MGDLLDCPFCGGEALVRNGKSYRCQMHGDKHETFVVECKHKDAKFKPATNDKLPECLMKPMATGNSKKQAITAWNTRAPQWQPISNDMKVGQRYEFLRADTGHRWFGRKGNEVWFNDGGFYGGEPTHYRSDENTQPPEKTP